MRVLTRPVLPRVPRSALDAVLAAVLLVVGQLQVWTGWNDGGVGTVPVHAGPARALVVAACTVPLAWRRSRPFAVLGIVCGALVVQLTLVAAYAPFLAGLLPMCIANYTVAAYGSRWRPAGLLAVFGVIAVTFAVIPEERAPGEVLFSAFVGLGTWIAGDVVRSRFSSAERAVGAARQLVAAREEAAAAALADERARIARELHDVIAHSVSVMGVQAGAARTLMDSDPAAARGALRHIEAAARDSVAELQRLLAVLREPAEQDGDLSPQPGLATLPRLVDQVRSAGLPVDLSMSGNAELPPGVDLAAYRIVQEALTNALKHAGAPTAVRVCSADGHVQIEVRDTGSLRPGGGTSGGHGLVGMRERAHLYGGTLEARPHPDGGFVVRARLPLAVEAM